LRLTNRVGGSDLGAVLRSLSVMLREDARLRGELEARQSWTVNAARLAVAAPWLVLGLMSFRPAAVVAYRSWTGALVLIGVLAVSGFAYYLMVRAARLPSVA
jgi:tight adherence protein B